MSILSPFPSSSMLAVPFCDYLNVTTPSENDAYLLERLVPLFESLGPIEATPDGSYRVFTLTSDGLISRGTFKLKHRGKVLLISASGGVLDLLRSSGSFPEYLSILSDVPHRVSMLHATQDYLFLSPSQAILAVKAAAIAGNLSLTRKRILPSQVSSLLRVNPDGEETGTIYLGNRANADVWAKVYDKREERRFRGAVDPGPIVRVEIAVQSDVGATLRDAFNPFDLFFNFAAKSLVQAPEGFVGWAPYGEGYATSPRVDRTVLERLENVLSFSQDLPKIIALATEAYGSKAGDVLARRIRALCAGAPVVA